jgi:hypothetical protein
MTGDHMSLYRGIFRQQYLHCGLTLGALHSAEGILRRILTPAKTKFPSLPHKVCS